MQLLSVCIESYIVALVVLMMKVSIVSLFIVITIVIVVSSVRSKVSSTTCNN